MRAGACAAFLLAVVLVSPIHGAEIVTVVSEPTFAQPGQTVLARVRVSVARGFHVQANPVLNRFLIPIVLTVEADTDVVPGTPAYPEPKTMRLEGSDEDLVIYDGVFEIRLPLKVANSASAKPVSLAGTLRYQACDDRHCLFPTTVPVGLRLEIKPR